MEIQALRLLITEQDLNDAAARQLAGDGELRELRVRLAPEGVYVSGVYHLLFGVRFETLWHLEVCGGEVRARLSRFQAPGIPPAVLRGTILSTVADAVRREAAFRVEGDTVVLDPDRLLAARGVPLRTNLTALRCHPGRLLVEATPAPA